MHHSVVADSILSQSVGSFHKGFHRCDLSSHLIHARTENGSLNLYHVLIAVQGRVNAYRVFVHEFEIVHVELSNAEHGVLLSCLTVDANGFGIGIASKSASVS